MQNNKPDDQISDEVLERLAFQPRFKPQQMNKPITHTLPPVKKEMSIHSNLAKSIYTSTSNNTNTSKLNIFQPGCKSVYIYSLKPTLSTDVTNTVPQEAQKISFSLSTKSVKREAIVSEPKRRVNKELQNRMDQLLAGAADYDQHALNYQSTYCPKFVPRVKQSSSEYSTLDHICGDQMNDMLFEQINNVFSKLHDEFGNSTSKYRKHKKKELLDRQEALQAKQTNQPEQEDEDDGDIFDDVDDDVYTVTVSTKDKEDMEEEESEEEPDVQPIKPYVAPVISEEDQKLLKQIEEAKQRASELEQRRTNQRLSKEDYESGYAAFIPRGTTTNNKLSSKEKKMIKRGDEYVTELNDEMSDDEQPQIKVQEQEEEDIEETQPAQAFHLVHEHDLDQIEVRSRKQDSNKKKGNRKRGREWQQIQDIIKKKKDDTDDKK